MSEIKKTRFEELYEREREKRDAFWREHPDEAKVARTQLCDLCRRERWGYPYDWWRFPATARLREMKGAGGIPDLACWHCYTGFCYLTEVLQRSVEEALLHLIKDRNWKLWLAELEKFGRNDTGIAEGPSTGHFAYVVQHFVRGYARDGEQPRSDFLAIPCYQVATVDGQLDQDEEGAIRWVEVGRGHEYSVTIWGADNLREYLRYPEAWLARQSDADLLSVEEVAQRLSISKKTAYEYCTQWYAYGEYHAPRVGAGEDETVPPATRTKGKVTRKIYNVRTANGIRVPAWAVALFKMWYEEFPLRELVTSAYDLTRLLSLQSAADPELLREQQVTWRPFFEIKSEGGQQKRILVGSRSENPEWNTLTFARQIEDMLSGAEGRAEGD